MVGLVLSVLIPMETLRMMLTSTSCYYSPDLGMSCSPACGFVIRFAADLTMQGELCPPPPVTRPVYCSQTNQYIFQVTDIIVLCCVVYLFSLKCMKKIKMFKLFPLIPSMYFSGRN